MEVNIRKIIEAKSTKLAKYIPNFVIEYLRRIVHEDEVNSFLKDFDGYDSLDFVRATLGRMNISYSSEGLDKLDPNGRYLFASNHPFGGMDGMMLAEMIGGKFGDVRVVVNDILMNVEPLQAIFTPINKHGRQNLEYANMFNQAFESEMPIITFPAGLCSRRIDGVVVDSEWKPTFIKRAISSQRDIVPVHFDGELSNFFYRLSNVRKKLGVKANVEMLYLVDEMFKQGGKSFQAHFGEPIQWQTIKDESGSLRQKADRLCEVSYNLKNK